MLTPTSAGIFLSLALVILRVRETVDSGDQAYQELCNEIR